MADAGQKGEEGMEKAKEAVTELVAEGVTEDIGVGEQRPAHKHDAKARKPRVASRGGTRQTWNDCVGEDADPLCFSSF